MLPCNAIDKSAVLPLLPQNLQLRTGRLIDALEKNPGDIDTKKSLLFLSTCHLYSQIPLPTVQKTVVVITGLVLGDGVGDYYHMLSVAELIYEKFPHLKVRLLAFFGNIDAASQVRKPNSQIETVFLVDHMVSDKASEWLESADQIIEISQRNTQNAIHKRLWDKKNYIYIGEYGYNSEHAMGLGKNNTGIIIKDKPTTQSIIDIQHKGLKEFLFKTQTPDESDLERYRSQHALFIGYLKRGSYYQTGFIYTLAAYLKSSSEKTIDILIPSVEIDVLDKEFLKKQGVGKIASVSLEGNEVKIVQLAPAGKELRLINPFPMEQKDLHTLLAYANILAGCAGDQTYSEVVSFDRLPFFENHEWKDLFYVDLIELAGTVGKAPHHLQQYFTTTRDMYDANQEYDIDIFKTYRPDYIEFMQNLQSKQPKIAAYSAKIAEIMQQEELYRELHTFNQLLRDHYSFAPVLYHIVKRQIAFNSYPELQNTELKIKEAFCRGFIDLTQGIEQLAQKINYCQQDHA